MQNTKNLRYHIVNAGIIIGIITATTLVVYASKSVYPFGNSVIAWGDMTWLSIPFLYDYRDILAGEVSPYFSWHKFGGTPDWSLSLFVTPFYLPLLLVERENIFQFVSILILFKMVCMGLAMYIFTNRYEVHRRYKIWASILYGVSPCVFVHYQIEYVMFDHAILFPILMVGFYRLMEQDKPLLYIILLAFTFGRSFYMGSIECFFLFFLSIAYFYFKIERQQFWSKCRTLTISTLIGIGLFAVFWLPAFFGIFETERLAGETQGGPLASYIKTITTEGLFSKDHFSWAICAFSGSGLLLACIRLSWKKLIGSLAYHKAQLAIILPAVFVPGTELLWHGGSRFMWPVRFAFIVTFVLLESFLSIRQNELVDIEGKFFSFRDLKHNRTVRISILVAIFICVCGMIAKKHFVDVGNGLMMSSFVLLALWLIYYLVILRSDIQYRNFILTAALLLELFFNQMLWLAPDWDSTKNNEYFFTATKMFNEIDHSKCTPLQRTRDIEGALKSNYSRITDTYSIAGFHGSLSKKVTNAYSSLGYGSEPPQILLDTGGTIFSDSLLGISSVFTLDKTLEPELYEKDESIKAVNWYWYRHKLPMVLEIQQDISTDDNIFYYQNNIFRAITNQDDDLITEYPSEIVDNKLSIDVKGRKILYIYGEIQKEGKGYRGWRHFSLKVNGEQFLISQLGDKENSNYPVEYNSRMLNLGTFQDETVSFEFDSPDEYDFSTLRVGGLDLNKFILASDELQRTATTKNINVDKSSINITQESTKGGLLFLPVPYNSGWHCLVNGEEIKIQSILRGFIGVPISAGNNEIKLEFFPNNVKRGIIVSLISVGCLLLLLLFRYKNIDILPKVQERIFGAFYLSIAVILIVAVYIVPFISGIVTSIQNK